MISAPKSRNSFIPRLAILAAALCAAFTALCTGPMPGRSLAAGPHGGPGLRGQQAPDFPPGAFSDGGHYSLSDFRGKVLVIIFYESSCPNTAAVMPKISEMAQSYADKPVKFIAIGAHDGLADVNSYCKVNKLSIPTFTDSLSIMSDSFGQHLSLMNVLQSRVIGPDGTIVGTSLAPENIARALESVKWKYKDDGYNPKLANAINLLEWNQFEAGIRALRPFLKTSDKAVAESANKLYDVVKKEGESWKADADQKADTDPVAAFDLYTQIATVFAADDLAKSVADPLKKSKASKAVIDELAARQVYAQLYRVLPTLSGTKHAGEVAQFCQSLIAKYPGTPTAAKAEDILKHLPGQKSAGGQG